MDFNNLLWEQDGRAAIVTYYRPKALNALNGETLYELEQAIEIFTPFKSIRRRKKMNSVDWENLVDTHR